jgi:Xaa-Pro dipeptidase
MNLKKLFSDAPEVEAIVLINSRSPHVDMSFFYVTGLTSGLFEGCVALVYPDYVELLCSTLEEESARKGGFEISVFATKDERETLLKRKLNGLKTIGINADELTYATYLKVKELSQAECVNVSKAITAARLRKEREEIARIKKACDIISEVSKEIPDLVEEGMTEMELAADLNYSMQKKGASRPAFPTLVCFGANASEPHHASGGTVLQKGDFILCDMGAEYKRYVSDLTRTFIFGKSTPEQEKMYETVLKSQGIALGMMKEGVEARDVHLKVKEFLDEKYEGKFIHGLGHSIGLSVHDGGGMNADSDIILEEGMVFTVEPGIYEPGYGGVRIEDNVVVTKDGVDILTSAPKELHII